MSCSKRKIAFCAWTIVFSIMTVLDLGDMKNYSSSPFLNADLIGASPILAATSLLQTQTILLRGCGICVILAVQSERFVFLLRKLGLLPVLKLLSRLRNGHYRKVFFGFVLLLVSALLRFAVTLQGAAATSTVVRASYFIFDVSLQESNYLTALVHSFPVLIACVSESLFAYACVSFINEGEVLLNEITEATCMLAKKKDADDFFDVVKSMHRKYDVLVNTVRTVENAFSWPIFICIVCDTLEVLVTVSWFVLYAYVPELAPMRKILKFSITIPVLALQFWMTLHLPVLLTNMQVQLANALADFVYQRQKTRSTSPLFVEYTLTKALAERSHGKELTVSVGSDVIRLTPATLFTIGYFVIGFTLFAIDRMESAQETIQKSQFTNANQSFAV